MITRLHMSSNGRHSLLIQSFMSVGVFPLHQNGKIEI
jgi:hypothetical protein